MMELTKLGVGKMQLMSPDMDMASECTIVCIGVNNIEGRLALGSVTGYTLCDGATLLRAITSVRYTL